MKLKRLEKNKYKKIIIGTLIVISIIVSYLLGKTFAMYQVNKSFEFVNGKVNYYGRSDVYFAYYNGNTWLDDIPKKNNADNLVYDHAVCDNDAIVEWDYDLWAPKVKNLTKAKTRCSLYFVNKDTAMKNCIASKKTGVECLEEVISQTNEMAYDETFENNLRYIGASPNNYVTFNNESWRIIGVMNNIKSTENGAGESRIKIIRSVSIGSIPWDSSGNNNWTRPASLNTTLQARSEASSSLIDNAVWNLGGFDASNKTAANCYLTERGIIGAAASPNTIAWLGKVGLIYPSDYGFAVGGTARDTCLKTALYNYNTNSCMGNDWLFTSNIRWAISSTTSTYAYSTPAIIAMAINAVGTFGTAGVTVGYNVYPVVYLKSSVKITGGTGSSSSPYTLSL